MTNRFRVWDGEHMWVPSEAGEDLVHFGLERDGTLYFQHEGQPVETLDGYQVLFYTDLDDCEGTPIYEGDIIKADPVTEPAEVKWSEGRGMWVTGKMFDGVFRPLSKILSLQPYWVVGNKYKDPNLLPSEEPTEV